MQTPRPGWDWVRFVLLACTVPVLQLVIVGANDAKYSVLRTQQCLYFWSASRLQYSILLTFRAPVSCSPVFILSCCFNIPRVRLCLVLEGGVVVALAVAMGEGGAQ